MDTKHFGFSAAKQKCIHTIYTTRYTHGRILSILEHEDLCTLLEVKVKSGRVTSSLSHSSTIGYTCLEFISGWAYVSLRTAEHTCWRTCRYTFATFISTKLYCDRHTQGWEQLSYPGECYAAALRGETNSWPFCREFDALDAVAPLYIVWLEMWEGKLEGANWGDTNGVGTGRDHTPSPKFFFNFKNKNDAFLCTFKHWF